MDWSQFAQVASLGFCTGFIGGLCLCAVRWARRALNSIPGALS